MSSKKQQFLDDKALRNAAKANVTTDVELIKADIQGNGPGKRLKDTGSEYARIFADGAAEVGQENKGKIAGGLMLGLAGLAAWVFRDEIIDAIDGFLTEDEILDAQAENPSDT